MTNKLPDAVIEAIADRMAAPNEDPAVWAAEIRAIFKTAEALGWKLTSRGQIRRTMLDAGRDAIIAEENRCRGVTGGEQYRDNLAMVAWRAMHDAAPGVE